MEHIISAAVCTIKVILWYLNTCDISTPSSSVTTMKLAHLKTMHVYILKFYIIKSLKNVLTLRPTVIVDRSEEKRISGSIKN